MDYSNVPALIEKYGLEKVVDVIRKNFSFVFRAQIKDFFDYSDGFSFGVDDELSAYKCAFKISQDTPCKLNVKVYPDVVGSFRVSVKSVKKEGAK